MNEDDRELCPKDPTDPENGSHCECWWDNEGPCCFCGDDTQTDEEKQMRADEKGRALTGSER